MSVDISTHGDVPGEIFVPVNLDCGSLSDNSYIVKDKPEIIKHAFIYDDDSIHKISDCTETI